jgi:hypothetical protein
MNLIVSHERTEDDSHFCSRLWSVIFATDELLEFFKFAVMLLDGRDVMAYRLPKDDKLSRRELTRAWLRKRSIAHCLAILNSFFRQKSYCFEQKSSGNDKPLIVAESVVLLVSRGLN